MSVDTIAVPIAPRPRRSRDGMAHEVAPGIREAVFAIPTLRCGGCVASVERVLRASAGVVHVRANLTMKRVTVRWREGALDSEAVGEVLARAGFPGLPVRAGGSGADRRYERSLLFSLGVAAFAAANIMLLSVAVWWGEVSDMDQPTQSLFHWLSAAVALPVVAFAGRPFFNSALGALRAGRLNMDVPISLAILLATGMSLFQTVRGSHQVYFDAATALLFFLLIGRYLDTVVRRAAQDAAQNLLSLQADEATLVGADGTRRIVAVAELRPGDVVAVAPGDRVPVDGLIRTGATDLDASLLTGEAQPQPAAAGVTVHAGVLNLTGSIEVATTGVGGQTLLAELARMAEAAEQGRARYVRLADRVARFYSPGVHLLGAITFIAAMMAGLGWEAALTRAIAVLIVTCPCALALAIPAAQVAASGRLFRLGILIKSADALERLAEVDAVVLDKTGTLTLGRPTLIADDVAGREVLMRAAAIAAASRHPLSRALVRAVEERHGPVVAAAGMRELPGEGLADPGPEGETRLGSAAFVGASPDDVGPRMQLWFAEPGAAPVRFQFEDALRTDASETIARLGAMALTVEVLSGDRPPAVEAAARSAGVSDWRGGVLPGDKIARLHALRDQGRKTLMVGDGLNDAPALAAAHASLSPSSASDIAQVAADAVFQGQRLGAVVDALRVARRTRAIVFENFALAFGYNLLFVPLAMIGVVTPLIAAIAMSTSSIGVTLNALRLRRA